MSALPWIRRRLRVRVEGVASAVLGARTGEVERGEHHPVVRRRDLAARGAGSRADGEVVVVVATARAAVRDLLEERVVVDEAADVLDGLGEDVEDAAVLEQVALDQDVETG